MPRLFTRGNKKPGSEPGTLVHVGEVKASCALISVFEYTDAECLELRVGTAEDAHAHLKSESITWLDIVGLSNIEMLQKVGDSFALHPLVLEDIANTRQRPKCEEFDTYIFVVLKMITYDKEQAKIKSEQVSFILGDNFVISFQEDEEDVFDPVRQRLKIGRGKIRKLGADYLLYALIDAIVDHYFVVLEAIGEEIETVEDELLENPNQALYKKLFSLKRELILLRRSVWPVREIVGTLLRDEHPFITDTTKVYLRDVYDHAVQIIDAVETLRDILAGLLDLYLSSLSTRMNEIMKVLTIMSSIFIPLTFIVGLYGMNFEFMPELHWRYGYLMVWVVMTIVTGVLLVVFRRKKWI